MLSYEAHETPDLVGMLHVGVPDSVGFRGAWTSPSPASMSLSGRKRRQRAERVAGDTAWLGTPGPSQGLEGSPRRESRGGSTNAKGLLSHSLPRILGGLEEAGRAGLHFMDSAVIRQWGSKSGP